ncbi:MAG: hypothetical protein JSR77_04455 [Planctomycetes bacterium]|nr:hypothetical protein [Planctomycetota bacterium]
MRITELHLAATTGNFAILRRKDKASFIEVEILTPAGTRTHRVEADNEDDIASMAECLHETLEGRRGTRGDVFEYRDAIQKLSDL